MIVLNRRPADANGANQHTVLVDDGQATRERDQPVVLMLDGVERFPRLRQLADLACRHAEEHGRLRLLDGDVNGPTQASSMRKKALRLAPELTTAMHICVSILTAPLRAASIALSALSMVTCIVFSRPYKVRDA